MVSGKVEGARMAFVELAGLAGQERRELVFRHCRELADARVTAEIMETGFALTADRKSGGAGEVLQCE